MLLDAFSPFPQATVTLTAGAAAVASLLPKGEYFEVQNLGTGAVYFETGPASIAAAAATGTPVLPNGWRQFRRAPGATWISIIAPTGGGTVYVTGGVGAPGARTRNRGRGTGGPSGPVAIFDAPLTTTLVPLRAGDPTFTFTRSSSAYVADNEGILRNAVSGEARFQGARRVQNFILLNSEDIAGFWAATNATVTAGIADPLGGTTASRIVFSAVNGANVRKATGPGLAAAGETFAASVWMRAATPGTIHLEDAAVGSWNLQANVTTTWQRFAATPVPNAGTSGTQFNFVWRTGDTALTIEVWHPQVERVNGQSNTAPGEYVSVGVASSPWFGAGVDGVRCFNSSNGNSVAANVVTEAQGTAIPAATLLGYVAENQATNLILQSQAFDNLGFGARDNCTFTGDTQVAPDGSLTADTFTDNATNAMHRFYQAITVTAATTYTMSVYAKAGTLTWMQLNPTNAAADRWANFNLVTGAVGNKGAGATASIQALPNGWYRCTVTAIADAASMFAQIMGALTNVAAAVPTYVGTGQTMYLWGAMVEAASDASSYIPTTAASVTRNSDSLAYTAPSSAIPVSLYAEFLAPSASDLHWITHAQNSSYACRQNLGTKLLYAEIVNTVALEFTGNAASSTAMNKAALRFKVGDHAASLNGGAVAVSANATAFTAPAPLYVGVNNTGSGQNINVRNVRVYATALTDPQLVTMTGP